MRKYFVGFFGGMFLTGSLFQINIGLPSFHKAQIKNTSKVVKNHKAKFKKGILKRATVRATAIAAETAIPIPIVTTGIAVTTVVAITVNEHCETQNALDNIISTLEGKEEKEMSISECSIRLYQDVKDATVESGDDTNQWLSDKYDNTSNWISDQWNFEDK